MTINSILQEQWNSPGAGFNGRTAIVCLWRTFPSLADTTPDGWEWNALEVKRRLGKMSTGQRHAASFVLAVWNPPLFAKGFEFTEAMRHWDRAHVTACVEWMLNPWWP